ncbi:MAG: polysaccharide biosynthesis C-terminal domain-containing protein [Cyclobacteriaceae bacterium]
MGIVIRQSFWGTLITYGGVAIGFISTLLVMPAFLDVEEIGLIRLIQSNALMIVPVALLGLNGSFIKYYPNFKNDIKLRNQIITMNLVLIGAFCFLATFIVAFSKDWLSTLFVENSPRYIQYLNITLFIFIAQSFFDYFHSFLWTQGNVIFQNFIQEILLRVVSLSLIVAFGLSVITFDWLIKLLALNYAGALFLLLVYAFLKYKIKLDFNFKAIPKEQFHLLLRFGIYTLSMTVGASILNNVSYAMTSSLLGLNQNGILTMAAFIATIIEMPKRVVTQIISPIISQDFKDQNALSIKANYQKASINLGVIGGLLAIGIITNLDDLFLIIPRGNEFAAGKVLIILFCLSRILNMFFGIASEVISYSGFYIKSIYIMLFGSLVMISMNLILIPHLGIAGVGVAFLCTTIVSQILRLGIIYRELRILPFVKKHWLLIILLGLLFLGFNYLPLNFHPIWNIALRSVLTTLVFGFLVYLLNVSLEVNAIIDLILQKIKKVWT